MTLSAPHRFSIVIVNYNGGEMLLDCVRSVVQAGVPVAHIVVVDNGSRDDSMRQLDTVLPGCETVRMGCNAGFARAVNKGLALVKTEFALLLNNDARLLAGAFEQLAQGFTQHARAAFLGGRLLYEDGRLQNAVAAFPRWYADLLPRAALRALWPTRYQGRPKGDADLRVESLIGAMFAVRMAAVHQLGALDEDFFFFLEETEWCHRAAKQGWEVWHIPTAQAIHLQGSTAKKYNALARIEYHRSRLLYFKKTAGAGYWVALGLTLLKVCVNLALNGLLVLLTLGLVPKFKAKAMVDGHILKWYAQACPAHVGLPDKCPP